MKSDPIYCNIPILLVASLSTFFIWWMGNLTSLTLLAIWLTALIGVGCLAWLVRPWQQLGRQAVAILNRFSRMPAVTDAENVRQAMILLDQSYQQSQTSLADYQQGVDAVLGSMVDGIIATNQQGKILFLNQAARRMLDIDVEQVIGKPVTGIVRYEVVQQAIRESLQTEKIVSAEFRTYDLQPRYVRLRVAPMLSPSVSGVTLVFHDFTELKKLETIRRDFVANISHELKTPLATIKGYAETLLMGAIDKVPENRTFLERINKQADLLDQQIQDLLHLARVESGREVFRFEAIDLVRISQELIQQFAEEATSKNVTLSLSAMSEKSVPRKIWADAEGVRTILSNLISNAIRYTHIAGENRKKTVNVAVHSDGINAWVEVSDNGIGIAKDHQQRIFERFFRVDAARSRDQGGTGLGLSIVKHLTQAFQGQVELESKPGKGSTFRVVFPLYSN